MDLEDVRRVAIEVYDLIKQDNCSVDKIKYILKGKETKSVLSEKINNGTLLTFSCEKNRLDLVEYFITECEVDVDATYDFPFFGDGCSLLCWACLELKCDFINLLLHLGADINFCSHSGKQPLHYLCSHSVAGEASGQAVSKLIIFMMEKGSCVDSKTLLGETPLMSACRRRHWVVVCEELISHGANVNATDNVGDSPLHYHFSPDFAGDPDGEVLRVLLKSGANLNHQNFREQTPVDILIKESCDRYVMSLQFLPESYLRLVFDNLSPNRKYHMLEIFGAMSALNPKDEGCAVRFWKEATELKLNHPELEYCRNTSCDIVSDFNEFEKIKDLKHLNGADRSVSLKQAIIKSYRHMQFDNNLTLILCRALLDFYFKKRLQTERMKFFTNMLDFISKEGRHLKLFPSHDFSAELLVQSFAMHWLNILRHLDYVEIEYTLKFLPMLLQFLGSNIHDSSLNREYGECVIAFIRHFLKLDAEVPKEALILLRTFIKLDVRFHISSRQVNFFHFTCERGPSPISSILRMLLQNGMSANEVDYEGDTALHKYLLRRERRGTVDSDDAAVFQILTNNTHMDIANQDRVTPLQLLAKHTTIYPLKHITLKCLAARVINHHGIQFVGVVPKCLESFIKLH